MAYQNFCKHYLLEISATKFPRANAQFSQPTTSIESAIELLMLSYGEIQGASSFGRKMFG